MQTFYPQPDDHRQPLPSLTGMRFIAALGVFSIGAAFYLFESPNEFAMESTWHLAAAGVSFFFILSGFILTWSAAAGDTAPRFWRRRFFKVYPNHLVTFVAALLILTLLVGESVASWLPNLLLVQSFSPDIAVRGGINGVAWTLSCEALFYFSFPFLIRAINRIRRERLLAWTGGVAVAILLVPLVARLTEPAGQVPFQLGSNPWETYIVYQFPPSRMLEFIFGIMLARMVLTGLKRWPGLGAATALVIAGFALTPFVPPVYTNVAVMFVPLGVLVVAGALADLRKRPTPLSSRGMVWLGEISFAFYMWHYLILLLGFHLLVLGNGLSPALNVALAVALLGVTVVVSWLQYTFVERPIMRRFAKPRRAAVGPQKTPAPVAGA